MAEKAEVRKCKEQYKDDNGKLHTCNTTLPKGSPECKNKARHMRTFPTGWCAAGFHEGTRARDHSGKPARICQDWQQCNCQCHKDIDELYVMAGRERTPQENPEYIPFRNPFYLPTPEERVILRAQAASRATGSTERVVVESPMPDAVPATVTRTFVPTPTGRAGRGELEMWVKQCCDEWIVEKPGFPCTPGWVADWIIKKKGVPSQSQGAVNAVFERWIALGFATIERKPTRFVGYTPDGIRKGLDAMKAEAKEKARRKTSDANKGIRV